MATDPKISPTLFDKLVGGDVMSGLRREGAGEEAGLASLRYFSLPSLDRFNEAALRTTVKRELAWLLNTTNLASSIDLEPYPEVQSSVLNYGVADLAGKSTSDWVIVERAREIEDAIRTFEPRIDPTSLVVEPRASGERENATTYVISAEVMTAARALAVQYTTDLEADTGAVTLRD